MSNKLQNIFNDEGNSEFEITLEASLPVMTEMKKSIIERKRFETDEIERITNSIKDGEFRYPIAVEENVSKVVLEPLESSEISINLEKDGVEKTVVLMQERTDTKLILHTKDASIINLNIAVDLKTNRTKISYSINEELATTMNDLATEYGIKHDLLEFLFVKADKNENYDSFMKYLYTNALYYQRIVEIEKQIDLHFNPKEQENTKDEIIMVDKLYVWLVLNEPIKSMDKIKNITAKDDINDEKLQLGRKFFSAEKDWALCNIFGVEFKFYLIKCFFNAIVSKIEKNENETIVYFEEKDSSPIFSSSRGFFDESLADQEMKQILDKSKEYENAKLLSEFIEEYN